MSLSLILYIISIIICVPTCVISYLFNYYTKIKYNRWSFEISKFGIELYGVIIMSLCPFVNVFTCLFAIYIIISNIYQCYFKIDLDSAINKWIRQ